MFGGDFNVIKSLEDQKKMTTLLNLALLQTKKSGKSGKKSGMKGAKKAAAGVQGKEHKRL